MQNIVARPFSLYGRLLFIRTRFSPTKTKQLSDFEFGKLFLIYTNFLLDYLI